MMLHNKQRRSKSNKLQLISFKQLFSLNKVLEGIML